MKIASLRGLGSLGVLGVLASCAALSQSSLPAAIGQGAMPIAQADEASRATRGLDDRDLLYASNANGTVSVFKYWRQTLVGVLRAFRQPLGECVDRSGDVYIADYKAQKVYEYAHGGTKRIKTINDSPYMPTACAIAPSNGDLAVANSPYDTYGHGGNIAIYRRGGGKPIILSGSGSKSDHFTAVAYDDRANLLAMSQYYYEPFWHWSFYYLAKGATKLLAINLPRLGGSSSHYSLIKGVAWDGKYWVVGPIWNYFDVYTIDVKGHFVSRIELTSNWGYVSSAAIYRKNLKSRGTQIIAGSDYPGEIQYWRYPAGGSPIGQIAQHLDSPLGLAISLGTPGRAAL